MSNKHFALLNVVGLSASLLSEHTPNINHFITNNSLITSKGVFPALTTSAQSTMLTGTYPGEHGIVGNGWYDRDLAEVMFWKQPNQLVQAPKIWEVLKQQDPTFTCSKLFWWYNMYAKVDASITPRPHYPADGRKIIDLYSSPPGLHQNIEEKIGKFPFFNFWGPKAGIEASQWISKAAMLEFEMHSPNLQLVYLPHLDYCLQKFGPQHESIPKELKAIDDVVGELLKFYEQNNVSVGIVSEYGIQAVNKAVHINRVLREQGLLNVRDSLTWELLDPGASAAFAVSDHQIAHIYINQPERTDEIKTLLENTDGIDCVLQGDEKKTWHIHHQRAGDLIAIAKPNAWFTYYYWLDDAKAPDFAPTVDIHRKPGYDPVEMFINPKIRFPVAKVMWRLLQKKLGFRMYMDLIPLDASLVKGSHGRLAETPEQGPLMIFPRDIAADVHNLPDVFNALQKFFNLEVEQSVKNK